MLPELFLDRVRKEQICDTEAFIKAHEAPAVASLRLNPRKTGFPLTFETTMVPWCPWGRLAGDRPVYAAHPAFHAGGFYVQEASSMFLWYVMDFLFPPDISRKPLVIVDLCGAPGGKATLLASWKNDDDLLVTHEFHGSRMASLKENVWKWGVGGVAVTGGPTRNWQGLPDFADVVVVDAPCSGEGLFRKDPAYVKAWRPHLNKNCSILQRGILQDAITMLKPGGFIVYSTCTYHHDENLGQVHRLVQQGFSSTDLSPPAEWNIVRLDKDKAWGYQFFPHLTKGEGFFISVVRKTSETHRIASFRNTRTRKGGSNKQISIGSFAPWDSFPKDRLLLMELNNVFFGVRAEHEPFIRSISDYVAVSAPGLPVGQMKGADRVWHPAAAHSTEWQLPLPSLELNTEEALSYLACNNLRFKPESYVQVTWHNLKLGLAKGHPTRPFINLYPTEWRLRKMPTISQI